MKRYRLVVFLLLLLASWSASAAEIIPLLSQSVLATASVRLDLRQELAGLVTEKMPEYSRPQLAAIQYRYEQQLQEKARLGRIDTDPVLVQRVRRIVRQLAGQAGILRPGAERWAWEVHAVNDPLPGAFSKPGGKIDITTGMINGRNLTDEEIAAVLAHEMGHVLTNRPLSHVPAIKRNQEIEADVTGLELMALAGFNPQAAIDALTGSSTGRMVVQAMDSHPTKLARAQLLNRLLPQAMALYRHALVPA
jgi:Zn-dependent protease with chaperone function